MGLKDELNKGVDEIVSKILTDIQAQDPDIDISDGSLERIRACAHAALNWGIRKLILYAMKQIHPDTADKENLQHHAWQYELTPGSGETSEELLARYLIRVRKPPAGGKLNDYIVWAGEASEYVASAYAYEIYPDLGSVGVLVLADKDTTGSEQPTAHTGKTGTATSIESGKLHDTAATFVTWGFAAGDQITNDDTGESATVTAVDGETELSLDTDLFTQASEAWIAKSLKTQVKDYILTKCPADVNEARLSMINPVLTSQDVEMSMIGGDKTQAQADVIAYMNALKSGETLYLSQLFTIAVQNGAQNATITTPAADVVPSTYESLRPGTVEVS